MIFVGLSAIGFRNKFVARNTQHGIEDAGISDAAVPELGVDHKLTSGGHTQWSVVSGRWSVKETIGYWPLLLFLTTADLRVEADYTVLVAVADEGNAAIDIVL